MPLDARFKSGQVFGGPLPPKCLVALVQHLPTVDEIGFVLRQSFGWYREQWLANEEVAWG